MEDNNHLQTAINAYDKIIQHMKPESSTMVKSCVVAVFSADIENPMRFTGKICLLHLDIDRHIKNYLLRLYDI
jgi:hypothetical protein